MQAIQTPTDGFVSDVFCVFSLTSHNATEQGNIYKFQGTFLLCGLLYCLEHCFVHHVLFHHGWNKGSVIKLSSPVTESHLTG